MDSWATKTVETYWVIIYTLSVITILGFVLKATSLFSLTGANFSLLWRLSLLNALFFTPLSRIDCKAIGLEVNQGSSRSQVTEWVTNILVISARNFILLELYQLYE